MTHMILNRSDFKSEQFFEETVDEFLSGEAGDVKASEVDSIELSALCVAVNFVDKEPERQALIKRARQMVI